MSIVAVTLAVLITGAAHGGTGGSAIPGSTLRLGMPAARIDSLPAFHVTGGTLDQKSGSGKFFGLPADAAIDLADGRIRHVRFTLADVSTHSRDYIEDELRRNGMHAECGTFDPRSHECLWTGRVKMRVSWKPGELIADVEPSPAMAADESPAGPASESASGATSIPGAGTPSTSPASATTTPVGISTSAPPVSATTSALAAPAMLPDTLVLFSRDESGPRAILIGGLPVPTYPSAARRAGVQGVVRVLATVDTAGFVIATSVLRSVRELDDAALAAARQGRFLPIEVAGRRVGFRVAWPFTFTIH